MKYYTLKPVPFKAEQFNHNEMEKYLDRPSHTILSKEFKRDHPDSLIYLLLKKGIIMFSRPNKKGTRYGWKMTTCGCNIKNDDYIVEEPDGKYERYCKADFEKAFMLWEEKE